jgi:hypothetical protein
MLSRIAEANRVYGGSVCLSALALQLVLAGQCSASHWPALSRLPGVVALVLLLYFLISATLSETDSNKDQRSTIQRWGALLAVLILLIMLGAPELILGNVQAFDTLSTLAGHYQIIIAMVLLLVLGTASWFVRVFTIPLPSDRDPTEADLIPMVRFCYVFTLLVIAISVIGPVLVTLFPSTEYNLMARAPVALVKGCVHSDDSKWELACSPSDPYRSEWFISIGGGIRSGSVRIDGTPHVDDGNAVSPVDKWIEVGQSHLMIVHGGLVVPWYFIALALMGAAVSLARKIPEYQRRALDKNDKEFTAARTREMMEFQILQLLSAPLIAVAAYNLVTPNSMQASAALGFITGFASETLLVGIRAVADRLMGGVSAASADTRKDASVVQAAQAKTI